MKVWANKSLQATRDGALSSAARFTMVGPACLSWSFGIIARHSMKTTAALALTVFLASSLTAHAQGNFSSSLSPIVPTPDNSWLRATGEFSLDGASTGFMITFGLEGVIPTEARLVGQSSDFLFDLGPAHIAIHSPGPWPDGYDGATFFYGSFLLPDALRDDFLGGRTTLLLTGSFLGDFQGAIAPVPEPSSVFLLAGGVATVLCFRRTRFQR
jgi:hypothetical protein